jgi:hypothetical protein
MNLALLPLQQLCEALDPAMLQDFYGSFTLARDLAYFCDLEPLTEPQQDHLLLLRR